jgi:hypothetical protein
VLSRVAGGSAPSVGTGGVTTVSRAVSCVIPFAPPGRPLVRTRIRF